MDAATVDAAAAVEAGEKAASHSNLRQDLTGRGRRRLGLDAFPRISDVFGMAADGMQPATDVEGVLLSLLIPIHINFVTYLSH